MSYSNLSVANPRNRRLIPDMIPVKFISSNPLEMIENAEASIPSTPIVQSIDLIAIFCDFFIS